MKHNLFFFLLALVIPIIGMRSPQTILPYELMDAIRAANYNEVVNLLNSNPFLVTIIHNDDTFTSNALGKYRERNQNKTSEYMKIARFLIDKGAKIQPNFLVKLQEFERSQIAKIPEQSQQFYYQPAPYPQLVYQQPAPVAQPMVQPTYYIPAPAPRPTPTPQLISKTTEEKFQNLIEAIRNNELNEVRKIVNQIDPKTVSAEMQEQFFVASTGGFNQALDSYARLTSAKEILKLLLSKSWAPSSANQKRLIDLHLNNQAIGNRSHSFNTPLIDAIQKYNFGEVHRLITQQHVDVNEPNPTKFDSPGSRPLDYAVANPNKEIVGLLLQHGARIKNDMQRAEIARILGRPI